MTDTQLKEYVSKVKDLEFSCYEQSLLCSYLENKIKKLENEQANLEQTKEQDVKADSLGEKIVIFLGSPLLFAFYGLLIGLVIGLIIGIVVAIVQFHNSLEDHNPIFVIYKAITGILFSSEGWGIIGTWIVRGLLFCGGGAAIIGLIGGILAPRTKRRAKIANIEIAKKNQEIDSELALYDKQIEMACDNLRVAEKMYQETMGAKTRFYMQGIIFEKYRDIVPISMFDEYLQSGRCSSLTGHEGAYNIYEQEKVMHLILTKLDDIIDRLDDIADSQRLLAAAIRESQKQTLRLANSIDNSLQQIEENTELSAYYDRINARNTSYMAWMTYLKR